MLRNKTLLASLVLLLCTFIYCLQTSHAALPKNYKVKRAFYDSLSLVLNKYIVPVGNWGLFEGSLLGIKNYVGESQFNLKSDKKRIDVIIKQNPPLTFSKDEIDTNAIAMIESLSTIFDSVFEEFQDTDKIRIIHAAIAGMIDTLEPNSYFIEPEDLERLQAQNRGVFEGIGLEITTNNGIVTVVSPYEDTPAFRQGLLPKDRITAVDSILTEGLRMLEVSEKIRGKKGTALTLTIERQGWDQPKDITLVRDTISHRTVKYFQLEPGFGYIRIINFLGTTDDDFRAAIKSLEILSPIKGLILDLRYNPGGLLNQSLGLADFFLNSGVIASTDGRIKSDNKTYNARPATLSADYPIVVLINGGSASGTEILASALRDHQRAVLIGERTFGKGYIQTIFPVQTGGAIRLTTSMLLTPAGEKIQNVGIEPDLSLIPAVLDYEQSSPGNPSLHPTLAKGATKDDPAVKLSLEVLKRSLLLQDMDEEELEGLSKEQAAVVKRFTGLNRAVAEVSKKRKMEIY